MRVSSRVLQLQHSLFQNSDSLRVFMMFALRGGWIIVVSGVIVGILNLLDILSNRYFYALQGECLREWC